MRHAASKFCRILALGLALSASALAAPSSSRLPTPAKPAQTDLDGQPAAADMRCVKGADGLSTCAAQAESFEHAAQAASYLGIYMTGYSDFAERVKSPENVAKVQKAVANCLQNPNCSESDKKILTAVILQYNLGKEVKSMQLKNNTNQANMESIQGAPGGKAMLHGKQRDVLATRRTYNETFKLQPKDFNTVESFRRGAKVDGERQSLGEEFKQDYLKFIDTYTQTTQDHDYWHRGYTKPTGTATTHAVWDIDPSTGAPKMQSDQFMFDLDNQNREHVKKIVAKTRNSIEAPEIEAIKDKPGMAEFKTTPREAMKFDAFDLGVPKAVIVKKGNKEIEVHDEAFVARDVAAKINKRIAEREAEDKKNKGVDIVNVQLGVEQFDNYLDKIWPKTGYKYKIPSQE